MQQAPSKLNKGKTRSPRLLVPMLIALLLITGFQVYWVNDNYRKEQAELETRTSLLFRDMLRGLQDSVLDKRLSEASNDSTISQLVDTSKRADFHSVRTVAGKAGLKPGNNIRFRRNHDSLPTKGVVHILRMAALRDSGVRRTDTTYFSGRASGPRKWPTVGDSILQSIDPAMIESVSVDKRGDSNSLVEGVSPLPGDGIIRIVMKKTPAATKTKPQPKPAGPGPRINFTSITLNNDNGQRVVLRLDSVLSRRIPDSLIRSSFQAVLDREKMEVPFSIEQKVMDTTYRYPGDFRDDSGLYQGYQARIGNAFPYLIKRVTGPIIFSLFLVALTVFSFTILYRSLVRQHRLAQMRSDLVSNITHELKTPIATVGVAIEALMNFNAIHDTKRTEEYLEISRLELQRLGLLVDKVLKLSMFENEHIQLAKEPLDLRQLVMEVTGSLRLQMEKQQAVLEYDLQGDLQLEGDRLHLLSVIFNLLDNALKYASGAPLIRIGAAATDSMVILTVADNGIGIPPAYRAKIFDKFFRVPQGNTHNAKGHGLGLSYASEVVRQHGGSITLESRTGEGSTFTISLPKKS